MGWAIFVVEFVMKVYVEKSLTTYLTEEKFDAAVSLVIIVFPIPGEIATMPEYFANSAIVSFAQVQG